MDPLILASKSKARAALLHNAGLTFESIAADIDERAAEQPLVASGASAQDIAALLAEVKAMDVSARHPGALVIGGDQTLGFGEKRFNKPENDAAARAQLLDLAGDSHQLHSAVACVKDGQTLWRHVSTATLTMRALSPEEVGRYMARVGEGVRSSVGCYQLEGLGCNCSKGLRATISPFSVCRSSTFWPSCEKIRVWSCKHMTDPSITHPKAFVIGWPIAHSKSPIIHNHWLDFHGLIGSYEKIAVAPEDLGAFLSSLGEHGFVGGNVTIPHKQNLLNHVDVISPTAKRLGAANTVWLEEGRLHADNTDGYGFLANLDQHAPDWDGLKGGRTLVLGAGGAARPIIDGLIERGFDRVTLVNRTREKADALAEEFASMGLGDHVETADWDLRSDFLGDIDLLVNTTSLGMVGQRPLDIELASLPLSSLVTDIVYNPLKTDLLQAAEARGNRTVDGLGMLLHQAVPGFERWFGVRPSVTDDVRQLVLQT